MVSKMSDLEKDVTRKDATLAAVRRVFTDGQLKRLQNPMRRFRWSPENISTGIAIHAAGPRAYRLLLRKKYPLPAVSTLQKWSAKIPMRPGILHSVLQIAVKANMTPLEKVCVLSFDEMKIKKKFIYKKETDETLKPASYAQVAIIRGLFGHWKQPVFYDFDCPMTVAVLKKIVMAVEKAGFRVVAMVCDLGGSNRGLLTDLGISVMKSWFPNPAAPHKNIYFFADVPHLLKLLRNHFIDSGLIVDGKEVNKSVIEEVISCTNAKSDLSIAYKISVDNLTVKDARRQNVKLAAKLFSNTVAAAIRRCIMLGEMNKDNVRCDEILCADFFKLVII